MQYSINRFPSQHLRLHEANYAFPSHIRLHQRLLDISAFAQSQHDQQTHQNARCARANSDGSPSVVPLGNLHGRAQPSLIGRHELVLRLEALQAQVLSQRTSMSAAPEGAPSTPMHRQPEQSSSSACTAAACGCLPCLQLFQRKAKQSTNSEADVHVSQSVAPPCRKEEPHSSANGAQSSCNPLLLCLYGFAGVGKSAVALALAHVCTAGCSADSESCRMLPAGRLWATSFVADLRGCKAMQQTTMRLCRAFGLVPLQPDQRLPFTWLAQVYAQRPCCIGLILDNADDLPQCDMSSLLNLLEQVHPLLTVVVTARSKLPNADGSSVTNVDVPPLTQVSFHICGSLQPCTAIAQGHVRWQIAAVT